MAETNKLLEETANYLLSHCFLLGGVEDQRSKYLYVQDHLNEVRAVFAPLGYAVLLYPAPLQAAALVNEHEGSQSGRASRPVQTRFWSRWKKCRPNCKK